MCEQTEINYLDGDVVWVKLGACWWPGQVTGFHNLPEDIQTEFQKKPLIAVVKFFQEDTYEFVKNYQQIYKYNCTQKDEFIKKGLDKYRSKSKDGSRYMDKFPGDVEIAEKLTGGDPDILNYEKFSPEEKPDISALFGDKKIPKKKRDRDDTNRRSDGFDLMRKITHPRFLKESDHEVRIRQQPSSLPSTPNSTGSPQYPCHLCSFTSSRVNVIICHIKSHKSGNSPIAKTKVKSYSQHRTKVVDTDTPKRKYVRKEKAHKNKNEYNVESGKRKQPKQIEKTTKKKKTDPKIRDTILADWEDESDDDTSLSQRKSIDSSFELNTLPTKAESDLEIQEELNKSSSTLADGSEIIEQAEKLLKETEKLTTLQTVDTSTEDITVSKSLKANILEDNFAGTEKESKSSESTTDEPSNKVCKEKEGSDSDHENKCSFSGKGDKRSLLSCFDFHEEELSVPPVRKKGRAFHQKKEIIKEFEMSQALKNEQKEKEVESSKSTDQEEVEKIIKKQDILDAQTSSQDMIKSEVTEDIETPAPKTDSTLTKGKEKTQATDGEQMPQDCTQSSETELEIVEIFEVEREEGNAEHCASTEKSPKDELKDKAKSNTALPTDKTITVENNPPLLESKSVTDDKQLLPKDATVEDTITEAMEQASTKETEESLSERFTTETEDEAVSESAETLPEQSENSDADNPDQNPSKKASTTQLSRKQDGTPVKKRRGRPRKNIDLATGIGTDAEHTKPLINKNNQEVIEMERRTSESDTERSYMGRRRKPNKKYVESDIYVQDIDQRAFKTDGSQSESDDKSSEKIKVKTKKGRKPFFGTDKKKTEAIQDIQEKEVEITDTLDIFDNAVVASKLGVTDDTHQINLSENKTCTEQKNKLTEDPASQQDPTCLVESAKPENPLKDADTLLSETSNSLLEDNATFIPSAEHKLEKESHKKSLEEKDDHPSKEHVVEVSDTLTLKSTAEKEQVPDTSETTRNIMDMLPPKKSQIKKFELSQLDFFEENAVVSKEIVEVDRNITKSTKEADTGAIKNADECDNVGVTLPEMTSVLEEADSNAKTERMAIDVCIEDTKTEKDGEKLPIKEKVTEDFKSLVNLQPEKLNISEVVVEESKPSGQQVAQEPTIQTKAKEKFTAETGVAIKKGLSEEKAVNTFQEAFLKTLHIDKKKLVGGDSEAATLKGKRGKKVMKRKLDDNDKCDTMSQESNVVEKQMETVASACKIKVDGDSIHSTEMSVLEGIEIEDSQKVQHETILEQENIENPISCSSELNTPKTSIELPVIDDSKPVSVVNESSRISTCTSSPSSEATIPVKKREMPRIIENVTLTEPMQILKSKLLDKIPQKSTKHKLDSDATSKGDQKCSPKAKIMKIENLPSNNKSKHGKRVIASALPLSKKMQILKAEEVETTKIVEAHNELSKIQTSQSATSTTGEKYIQQSSQSLAEMELDINSMPFVLSDDVLTPESIEQMPVVISSIIPASSTMPATLSLTPTTQTVSHVQTQMKPSESHPEISPAKKKSGTPAILKAKNKAKPTITSIKTIVPPLTGGVKGIKFQNTQSSKTTPLLTQKGTAGKYVVVQTSSGQQLRYTVQGKSGTQQKIAIPAGKGAANAQLVQQGGKVVILTSAQSGQTKMLPLNITKSLGGKVQRIITSKGQVLCSLNPQSIITSKTMITPKGDGMLPTTSKLAPSHKIINTQGIITSKGVLTPIPETIAKSGLLGTLPQGILTKGGIYTPISTTTLGGKTIIGSKSLVTKGATLLSSQNLGTSKAILTSISPAICGKTILTTQGLVSTKGTVLTPITGQQVKAIAAKSPGKGGKVQYQSVQQKVQLPMLQKSQKIAMSPSTQGKQGHLKAASSTLVVQSASATHKNVLPGKKVIKQSIIQPSPSIQNIVSQSAMQQTVGIVQQIQQKGKTASTMQKVIMPRGSGRQTKNQQKILVQKIQEPSISAVQNIQTKQILPISSTSVTSVSKGLAQQKYIVGSSSSTKAISKPHAQSKPSHQQKNLLHIAMNATATTNINTNIPTTLSLPISEPIEPEKKLKSDHMAIESTQKEHCKVEKLNIEKGTEAEKLDEPKVSAQPQIMALPTESSDGTQTYVLVTIDEQGQIQPLDNNTLMSLEGTTQNPDGTRTLYIDPSSLGEAGAIDNIVLQFDNGVLPGIHTSVTESTPPIMSESFQASDVMQSSNQDILAAALANTDFQQEISLPENPTSSVVNAGLTQTSLINQTILQSTIIPPTEPISSPSVLETSLTLNQPIMTPLEVPTSLPIQSEAIPTTGVPTIPSSLGLPITITNPNISYISAGDPQIQIPANSMPDIGSIIENPTTVEISSAEHSDGTQYLVIPNLDGDISDKHQVPETTAISISNTPYSVSIPGNIVLQTSTVQTTPSMPIIDDTYADTFSTSMKSIAKEQTFVDPAVSEMLVPKSRQSKESPLPQEGNNTSEILITSNASVSSQETIAPTKESTPQKKCHASIPLEEVYSSQEVPISSEELILQQTVAKEDNTSLPAGAGKEEISNNESTVSIKLSEHSSESMASSMPIVDESSLIASEPNIEMKSVEGISFQVTDSSGIETNTSKESKTADKFKELSFSERSENEVHSQIIEQQATTSNEVDVVQQTSQASSAVSKTPMDKEDLDASADAESPIYTVSSEKQQDDCQRDEPSSHDDPPLMQRNLELQFNEANDETSHETPSQSYDQFGISMTSGSADLPSQSLSKSENSREPTQSVPYEPMETDDEPIATEPPTQSFQHAKINEASQSYEASEDANTNAPTQSFNEVMQNQKEISIADEVPDDQTFPTQSYEVDKANDTVENLETDAELSQEGNIPSQSNDIGVDGIGTSSVSTNNSGLNEDETASSSYVPETPENQERDQDQESAISTSSYEIPPCEELNIGSSSVIPDTSIRAEHTSIHDNGVPEIPTSSYNLNPDITSTHVDSIPTSSYEDQVIVEQNVSTSYEVPMSMPGLEETCSQNFVTESSDHRNEPSSYYAHNQEVTASYYEPVDQESNSRLDGDSQEEATPSYYEGNQQEASQSYFHPEEASQSYSGHNVSASYYDPRPESEASQSYYSADDMEKAEQTSSQNIEASQSFYQEQTDELKLQQQGEATPAYSERYPVDYTLDHSPIERHDLVESSVPATRPMER